MPIGRPEVPDALPAATAPAFRPLAGVYEPSAILQLPDGRFLVVEDEKAHPFAVVAIGADGSAAATPLTRAWLDFDDGFWKLDDLEGLTLDGQGRIYAITSHSRDGDGDEKKSRDKLVNPAALFEAEEAPRVAPGLITLDLSGHGIRGLGWIPALNGYLVISGPVAREQVQFRLWFWSGEPASAARPVTVPGLAGFEHAEGVTAAMIGGRPAIVVVSDDGSRKEGRPARYLVLEPAQVQVAA